MQHFLAPQATKKKNPNIVLNPCIKQLLEWNKGGSPLYGAGTGNPSAPCWGSPIYIRYTLAVSRKVWCPGNAGYGNSSFETTTSEVTSHLDCNAFTTLCISFFAFLGVVTMDYHSTQRTSHSTSCLAELELGSAPLYDLIKKRLQNTKDWMDMSTQWMILIILAAAAPIQPPKTFTIPNRTIFNWKT